MEIKQETAGYQTRTFVNLTVNPEGKAIYSCSRILNSGLHSLEIPAKPDALDRATKLNDEMFAFLAEDFD